MTYNIVLETSQKRRDLYEEGVLEGVVAEYRKGTALREATMNEEMKLGIQRPRFSEVSKIALVGGGTGGHIMPILSLIAHLDFPKDRFFWIGGKEGMEEEKVKEVGVEFFPITTYKLKTTKSLGVLLYPSKLLRGIFEARKILKKQQPKLVFSKGGPGSVAVGMAAWTLSIPLYIHESDTIPGFSNRVLGYFASRIFLGFDEAKKWFPAKKTLVIGQIIHPDFFKENPTGSIEWKTEKKHIFVNCGSQGSRKIFQTLLSQKNNLPDAEWIISLGTLNRDMRSGFESWQDTQVFDWIDQKDIPHILDETQVAITRASATTLAELATRPIHLIIIPLAISAGNHQLYNAKVYEKMGHAVVEEKNLNQKNIGKLLESNGDIKAFGEKERKIKMLLNVF